MLQSCPLQSFCHSNSTFDIIYSKFKMHSSRLHGIYAVLYTSWALSSLHISRSGCPLHPPYLEVLAGTLNCHMYSSKSMLSRDGIDSHLAL